jgi:hypothetical protein
VPTADHRMGNRQRRLPAAADHGRQLQGDRRLRCFSTDNNQVCVHRGTDTAWRCCSNCSRLQSRPRPAIPPKGGTTNRSLPSRDLPREATIHPSMVIRRPTRDNSLTLRIIRIIHGPEQRLQSAPRQIESPATATSSFRLPRWRFGLVPDRERPGFRRWRCGKQGFLLG